MSVKINTLSENNAGMGKFLAEWGLIDENELKSQKETKAKSNEIKMKKVKQIVKQIDRRNGQQNRKLVPPTEFESVLAA